MVSGVAGMHIILEQVCDQLVTCLSLKKRKEHVCRISISSRRMVLHADRMKIACMWTAPHADTDIVSDGVEQAGIEVGVGDSCLSYLPLAHIYDRIAEDLVLSLGGSIGYWQVRAGEEAGEG